MITLVTLPPAFGLRNISPFCLKVEMALTHVGVPFRHITEKDPRKAPKGKLPYLVLENGEKLADSELILQYLDQSTEGKLYGGLSPRERGEGFAWSRLAEDHLYWLGVASRWLDDQWFPNIVREFFGFVPAILRPLASGAARRQVARTLNLHGLGRHTLAEQKDFARRDLQALSDGLELDRYIVGRRMTVFDFTIAGMLSGFMDNKPATWFSSIANEYTVLRQYLERIQGEVGVHG
jgi:glutathione S-transferase